MVMLRDEPAGILDLEESYMFCQLEIPFFCENQNRDNDG